MAEIDLTDRVVVVTGASRGIGAAIAEYAVRAGAGLGACARTDPAVETGKGVVAMRVDVTDEPAVQAFADRVEEQLGPIDLWINNAGVLSPIAPIRDVDVADFRQHIDVNLTGVFIGTKVFVRHRHRHGGGGVLINVSSGAAWKAYAGWGPYCAGKAGIERLTDVIAVEERGSGLRAHAIAPGVVDTDMQALIRDCSPERFPTVADFIAMKRDDRFNSGEYVAGELMAIAFDPARATDEVSVRLAYERDPA